MQLPPQPRRSRTGCILKGFQSITTRTNETQREEKRDTTAVSTMKSRTVPLLFDGVHKTTNGHLYAVETRCPNSMEETNNSYRRSESNVDAGRESFQVEVDQREQHHLAVEAIPGAAMTRNAARFGCTYARGDYLGGIGGGSR